MNARCRAAPLRRQTRRAARSPRPRHPSIRYPRRTPYASGNAGDGEVGLSISPNPVALSDMRRRSAKLGIAAVVGGDVDLHRPASRSSGESSSLYEETFLYDETSVDLKELLLDLKESLLDLFDLKEAPPGRTDSGDSPAMEARRSRRDCGDFPRGRTDSGDSPMEARRKILRDSGALASLRSEPWRAFDSIDSRSVDSSERDSTCATERDGGACVRYSMRIACV